MLRFSDARHALQMVRRNRRSYRLLSVTIILSLSLLLGYLAWVDSKNYNRYKEAFSQDRSLVFSSAPTNAYRDRIMREKAAEIGTTYSLLLHTLHGLRLQIPNVELDAGERLVDFGAPVITLLPKWVPELYDSTSNNAYTFDPVEITWLDGNAHEGVHLEPDEIIVDDQLYEAVGHVSGGVLRMLLYDGSHPEDVMSCTLRIAGTIPVHETMEIEIGDGAMAGKAYLRSSYCPRLILSEQAISPADYSDLTCFSLIAFVSDQPELVAKLVDAMNPNGTAMGVFKAQDRANDVMTAESRTKALICSAMLLILGVNLYSCFANALNERKFEIGVKRAIGASAWRIVMQFLQESVFVMLVNASISVALVADIFVVYKYIYERTPNEYGQFFRWTIYLSPHSAAMFAISTITLTIVFSLIFAYRSTQVRIADQLKAE